MPPWSSAEQAFRQLAQGLSESGSERVLENLVARVAAILRVDHALVAEVAPERQVATTLACWSRLGHVEPLSYALAGTPCQGVVDEKACYYRSDVGRRFPEDHLLAEIGAEGYFGVPIRSPDGRLLGLLAVLHNAPLELPDYAGEILALGAAQAGAELARRQALRHTHWDSVTGLPNRHHFMERLVQACNTARYRGEPLALLHLDLQRFKAINDLYGHAVGDQLLAKAARRFLECCQGDELVARLGGDEYAVLLPGVDVEGLPGALARFQAATRGGVTIGEQRFEVTSCIGAACLPRHASTAEQLMQCSGIALSHAKQPGRHWRIFDGEMAERLHRREQLKRRLAVAISEQRLTLHYQPQIELASGRLIGAEALCRWQDEEWGWISPAEFVPLAERHGLIETLGRQVILQGCRQLAQWQAAGHPLPGRLSINLSAGQLDDPRLVERLLALTQGIAPSRLGFEITETALMRAPEQATRITRALRGLGYALAIDDFGIGYSSLNYLKRLAADTLKIDIAFVRDMLVDRQDHAIVATIIAMARTLGMRTVAEGVEQQAQVEALRELGCDGAQGYCFGRPVDADAFARLWLTG